MFIFILELWNFNNRILKLYIVTHDWIWHHLSQAVSLGVRHLKHTCNVAHGVLTHHLTEGTNVSHATLAIFFGTVFYHLVTTGILNVSINIRHGDTVWVKEALKE